MTRTRATSARASVGAMKSPAGCQSTMALRVALPLGLALFPGARSAPHYGARISQRRRSTVPAGKPELERTRTMSTPKTAVTTTAPTTPPEAPPRGQRVLETLLSLATTPAERERAYALAEK